MPVHSPSSATVLSNSHSGELFFDALEHAAPEAIPLLHHDPSGSANHFAPINTARSSSSLSTVAIVINSLLAIFDSLVHVSLPFLFGWQWCLSGARWLVHHWYRLLYFWSFLFWGIQFISFIRHWSHRFLVVSAAFGVCLLHLFFVSFHVIG